VSPRPAGLTLENWDLGGEPSRWAYLHAGELFRHVEIPTAGPPTPLPEAERPPVGQFHVEPGLSLDDSVAGGPVDGIVIVHRGRIVYQRYPRMRSDDRHLLMSVSKVFVSLLVGILEARGLDLATPVDRLIDELAGSGWAGVSVDDVLHMASGIDCLEVDDPGAYTDPAHPFYRFEASLGWRPAGPRTPSAYELVAALPPRRPPGEAYEYTSVNTFVLSWLLERLTGRAFQQVLGDEIWSGFEAPAQLLVGPDGAPASHGGLSTTLRDLARLGMLFTPSAPAPVVDPEHLRRIQTGGHPERHRRDPEQPDYVTAAYGPILPPASRQWTFAMPDGDLFKGGFGGQGLYVSPGRDLVIAFAGTPGEDGVPNRLRWYARRLAISLF
jgi:CubicO group peptidase (beta-lactamase class C family)